MQDCEIISEKTKDNIVMLGNCIMKRKLIMLIFCIVILCSGCNKDIMKEWHDKQEEEAYNLMREVLLENHIFYYYGDISGNNEGYMNMSLLLEKVFENRADTSCWKFMFVDLDGEDGVKECILRCLDSETHYNIIFHYFAGEIYASELTYRNGEQIYKNGIIDGGGTVSSAYWNKLCYDYGKRAYHKLYAGWYIGHISVNSIDDYADFDVAPVGSRTEAWITVDGILTEVPQGVCKKWMEDNNFPGELADEYDYSEENIREYIVK